MLLRRALTFLACAILAAACSTPAAPGPQPTLAAPTQLPATLTVPPATPTRLLPAATATLPPDAPVTGGPGSFGGPGPNPWAPQPGDATLARGAAVLEASQLRVMESFPVQVMLSLSGHLPTPCHQLRVTTSVPDAQNRIQVSAYSVVDPGQACTQVLQPFQAQIPLGSFPAGSYTVWVNGEMVGEFRA